MLSGKLETDGEKSDSARGSNFGEMGRKSNNNGSECIQFKNSAPLKVNQDIALTLPEYAVFSVAWAE